MKQHLLLWPLLTQMSLTILVYLALAIVKRRAIATQRIDLKRVALDATGWPDSVKKVSNNLDNQFQSPVLFYTLCLILMSLDAVNTSAIGTAWLYVVSRIAHTLIHTTSNVVRFRLPVFTLGIVALAGLLALALRALVSLP